MPRATSIDPLISLQAASLQFGNRTLWQQLLLSVTAGEFVAVLGPNGAGKSSLLKVLLGLQPLSGGQAVVAGQAARRGNQAIGYIPQQKSFDPSLPLRGRDLVELGINGHRFGVPLPSAQRNRLVDAAIEAVGASAFADRPLGLLSGGEQQRLRVAQAIVGKPRVLLCDEPLLSLDLAAQRAITNLLHSYCQREQAAVVFVTHEINPILPFVNRILYLANGNWIVDQPEQVLRSATLSQLYGTPVEVLRVHGRVLVVGAEDISGHSLIGHQDGHHA